MSIINEAFEAYYLSLWEERWVNLRASLFNDKEYTAMRAYNNQVQEPYFMDHASVKVASLLNVTAGESVLDLCAAPGGKSMVLLNQLQGQGSFWANDKERYSRLANVLRTWYPEEKIRLSGWDARTMGQRCSERFDAILLDAPCSSEWHWLKDEKLLMHWRITRPKRLAINQYALLASALTLLKIGGRCLYVTCAINPMENQQVIQKALKRWGSKISIDQTVPAFAEAADPGFYCLPDSKSGGPLYACLLWRQN